MLSGQTENFLRFLLYTWPMGKHSGKAVGHIPCSYFNNIYRSLDNGWLKHRVAALLDSAELYDAFANNSYAEVFTVLANDLDWHKLIEHVAIGSILVNFGS